MWRMSRPAAIVDVGSNTVRLLVARRRESTVMPTYTDGAKLGLGREIEACGRLSDTTIAATADTVRRFCADARAEGAESIEVIVTAPGRQAENAAELVEATERAAGLVVRVVSADEEAQLAFAGAVAVANPSAPVVGVVDLGGASTELAVGCPNKGPSWARSVDLGAVRLTDRLLGATRPAPEDVDAARKAVADAFSGVTPPLPGAALAVGGSARALGRLLGPCLGRAELAAAASILPACMPDALVERFGVGKQRAPLLLAAALILAEVQQRLLVPLAVTEGSVREGALVLGRRAAEAA
jgi:exopolyphosphatase/guanosine-5'-triphosphate,3'-diphosphate pyrophosphatase